MLFRCRVKPLEWLLDFVPREELRNDPGVLGIDNIAFLQRAQSAERNVL